MAHREEIGHLESRLDAAKEANRHGSEQYDNLEEEFRQCQLTNREQELDLAYVDNKANIAIDQAGNFFERLLRTNSNQRIPTPPVQNDIGHRKYFLSHVFYSHVLVHSLTRSCPSHYHRSSISELPSSQWYHQK